MVFAMALCRWSYSVAGSAEKLLATIDPEMTASASLWQEG